jgi:hypothetical protein
MAVRASGQLVARLVGNVPVANVPVANVPVANVPVAKPTASNQPDSPGSLAMQKKGMKTMKATTMHSAAARQTEDEVHRQPAVQSSSPSFHAGQPPHFREQPHRVVAGEVNKRQAALHR